MGKRNEQKRRERWNRQQALKRRASRATTSDNAAAERPTVAPKQLQVKISAAIERGIVDMLSDAKMYLPTAPVHDARSTNDIHEIRESNINTMLGYYTRTFSASANPAPARSETAARCSKCGTVTTVRSGGRTVCPNDPRLVMPVSGRLSSDADAIDKAFTAFTADLRCGNVVRLGGGPFGSGGWSAQARCNDLLGHSGPCGVIVGTWINADGNTVRGAAADGRLPLSGEKWG